MNRFDQQPTTDNTRYDHGRDVLNAIDSEAVPRLIESLQDVAPALADHVIHAFSDVYARPSLKPQQRQLVTLGMLTALGGCEAQLEFHVNASLNVGLTPVEIVEALIHSSVYCGFPKALNAVTVAKKVFAARDLLPVANPASVA